MIKITMKNGNTVEWANYSDYKYDGKFFIVIRGDEWVGFYNLDHVISITVTQPNTSIGDNVYVGEFPAVTTPLVVTCSGTSTGSPCSNGVRTGGAL